MARLITKENIALSHMSFDFSSFFIFRSHSIYTYGNVGRFFNMVRQASSSIHQFYLTLLLVLFNRAECKSGGGHYSSQRTLGSASIGGSQSSNSIPWSNTWLPLDINTWYDYGMEDFLLLLLLFRLMYECFDILRIIE